jgi:hypothetical protein
MKIIGIALMLMLIGIASATTNEEIMNYALGVFDAGSGLSTSSNVIGIKVDNTTGRTYLTVDSTLSEYATSDTGGIGYQIWDLSRSAGKVIAKYPDDLSGVAIGIIDKTGSVRGAVIIWAS